MCLNKFISKKQKTKKMDFGNLICERVKGYEQIDVLHWDKQYKLKNKVLSMTLLPTHIYQKART